MGQENCLAEFVTALLSHSVQSLVARLTAFQPDPIGIEDLAGIRARVVRFVCWCSRRGALMLRLGRFHCIEARSEFRVALPACLATRVQRLSKNSFRSQPAAEQCLVLLLPDGFGSVQPLLSRLPMVADKHE